MKCVQAPAFVITLSILMSHFPESETPVKNEASKKYKNLFQSGSDCICFDRQAT